VVKKGGNAENTCSRKSIFVFFQFQVFQAPFPVVGPWPLIQFQRHYSSHFLFGFEQSLANFLWPILLARLQD